MYEENVKIPINNASLQGSLVVPKDAKGMVIFAHGSGSSRFSPRNQFVAKALNKKGIATLLMDLLTEVEEQFDMQTGQLRFDIEFLAERLIDATKWIKKNSATSNLKIGYFGASTGAAAALIAAAKLGYVLAIVSRGGRPDLAMPYLSRIEAPTLLIVGGNDEPVIGMNREAIKQLNTVKKLEIISGASHLFEEPGKLEEVAKLAANWFIRYFADK